MPLLDFDPANKTESGTDYPKLKLDTGEYARVLAVDKVPTFAYAHRLVAPKILMDEPVKKTVNRKDGSSFTDYVKDFLGQPQCLGDLGIMQNKGSDPRNCPLCARAEESGEVDPAKRRMAMHVIQYATKHGGWDLRTPYGVELVVWAFTDMVYNKLNNISNLYGNLRDRDLFLGPCTDKDFQKFEIIPGPDAAWQKSDQLKTMVLETYRENRYPGDLENFCGRKTDRAYMLRDIERIAERWRVVNQGTGRPAARPDGTEQVGGYVNHGLAVGLDGLDAATPQTPAGGSPAWLVDPDAAAAMAAQQQQQRETVHPVAQRVAAGVPPIDFDDLLGPGTAPAAPAPAAVPVPPAAVPATAPPVAVAGDDFDSLLDVVGSM